MKKFLIILIGCSIFFDLSAQNLDAYNLFTKDGTQVSFNEMSDGVGRSSVILFGELHDNPICHWLEIELTNKLHQFHGSKLILGAEMFETDNQLILDEYVKGQISQTRFEADARLWANYKTDYKPLVEFAKENKLSFVATNVPRRYASMVASGGFEALELISSEAKNFIAPLPISYNPELPGYKSMLSMMGMAGKGSPDTQNLPKAQALKDATMAWSILNYLEAEGIFIHFHGTYHSNNYEGIVWYLKEYKNETTISTIASVIQDDTQKLEESNLGIADYIIVVPKRMTRTY